MLLFLHILICKLFRSFIMKEMENKMVLAMTYVPWQKFEKSYEPQVALKKGTIFPELDKPFYGKEGVKMYAK